MARLVTATGVSAGGDLLDDNYIRPCAVAGSVPDDNHQIEVSLDLMMELYWRVKTVYVRVAAGLMDETVEVEIGWSTPGGGVVDGYFADETEKACKSALALFAFLTNGTSSAQVSLSLCSSIQQFGTGPIAPAYKHSSGLWLPQLSLGCNALIDYGAGTQVKATQTVLQAGTAPDDSTTVVSFDGFNFSNTYTNNAATEDMGGLIEIVPASWWPYDNGLGGSGNPWDGPVWDAATGAQLITPVPTF